jgi:4-amino-4-deoxy-L-arabinose transferase-like glycosyltransferase
MTRLEGWLLGLALIVATGSLAAGIGRTDLWPPNETRVAEIAREMLAGGSWLVPHLNGRPFLEEPPLFYWAQATVYAITSGPSALAARVPATAAAILGVLVTAALAQAVGASAAIAALVVATAPEYWWMARTGTPDTANAAATGLALLAFLAAWRSGSGAMLALAVVAGAIAFWLKSLLGVGLAAMTALIFLIVAGPGRLGWRAIACAVIASVAAAACWLVLLWRGTDTGSVSFFLVSNHLGRLLGSARQGHVRPIYYYLLNLLLDLLPWSVALPAALVSAVRERADGAGRFPLVWAGVMTLALSVSVTKSAHYLLPAYPAFAVLLARWWVRPPVDAIDRITWRILAVVLIVVVPAATAAIVALEPAKVMSILAARGHRLAAVIHIVREAPPGPPAWGAAGLVLLVGLACRPRRPVVAAVAAATSGMVVHLLIATVTLPAFNGFASARPIGEALGRAAEDGVDVFTFGFANPEEVSPVMFYAARTIPEVQNKRELRARLREGRACGLVRGTAYTRLPPDFAALPRTHVRFGELALVLLGGSEGACPRVPLVHDRDSDYPRRNASMPLPALAP